MNDDGITVGLLGMIGVELINGWVGVSVGVISFFYVLLKVIAWFPEYRENKRKRKKEREREEK